MHWCFSKKRPSPRIKMSWLYTCKLNDKINMFKLIKLSPLKVSASQRYAKISALKSEPTYVYNSHIWYKVFGLAKIRCPFHFKRCYINVILYSNIKLWWYILHCRDQKKAFQWYIISYMLHVFIYVNLRIKLKQSPFLTVILLHFIFCKLKFVIFLILFLRWHI